MDNDPVCRLQHPERQGHWQLSARHRGKEFIKFLNQLEKELSLELDIHLILDNYSTHKSAAVQRWLKPGSASGFTSLHTTSGSWLNQ